MSVAELERPKGVERCYLAKSAMSASVVVEMYTGCGGSGKYGVEQIGWGNIEK